MLAVSSLVVEGSVGLRAAGFALERRGHPVRALPTVLLTWHPGKGPATRLPTDEAAFSAMAAEIAESPAAARVAAVLTGYFASPAAVEATARAIDRLKARRPGLLVLVDPVSADARGPYVPGPVIEALARHLVPRADILTPNRFELALLAGRPIDRVEDAVEAAARLGVAEVVVTSLAEGAGLTGAVHLSAGGVIAADHPEVAGAPHGTGDLLAALFLSERLAGRPPATALRAALGATFDLVEAAVAAGSDDLPFAARQAAIADPPTAAVRLAGEGGPPLRVMGVDGCRSGWIAVAVNADGPLEPEIVHGETFGEILAHPSAPVRVAVDMPIGLPDRIEGPGRVAEQAVRPLLGERQSSVFSVPARPAVMAATYEAACAAALATSDPPRKVSRQSFLLFPKIREIDALLDPALAERVFEVHPEVTFWRLNGERPMALAKKVKNRPDRPGIEERIALLARYGYARAFFDAARPSGCGIDDLVDAAANAIAARRILAGDARPFPDPPGRDGKGLPVAIWA